VRSAIAVHLFDRFSRMVHEIVPRKNMNVFSHPRFRTNVWATLDVELFSLAGRKVGFPPICKSTIRPIVCAVDGTVLFQAVALSTAAKLSDEEKLEVLRRLDQFRQWRSLDDKRYCLVCGTLISGRQIQVGGGTRGNGPLRLSCPTERCNSIPMDWVLPTDEILAKVEKIAAEERKAAELKPIVAMVENGGAGPAAKTHDDRISRLLKFVLPFKRYS
jgi:hypothetical protein